MVFSDFLYNEDWRHRSNDYADLFHGQHEMAHHEGIHDLYHEMLQRNPRHGPATHVPNAEHHNMTKTLAQYEKIVKDKFVKEHNDKLKTVITTLNKNIWHGLSAEDRRSIVPASSFEEGYDYIMSMINPLENYKIVADSDVKKFKDNVIGILGGNSHDLKQNLEKSNEIHSLFEEIIHILKSHMKTKTQFDAKVDAIFDKLESNQAYNGYFKNIIYKDSTVDGRRSDLHGLLVNLKDELLKVK